MKEHNNIAYCGLYCPMCSFAAAAETGERKHLAAMPESYNHLKAQSLEACACPGCKTQVDHCSCRFGIKICAEQKNIASCADCESFPCDKISAFGHDGTPHHEEAFRGLTRIKETGYEAWLAEMKVRIRCSCGERQSWYYKCPAHP